jgi:hypothetical protein
MCYKKTHKKPVKNIKRAGYVLTTGRAHHTGGGRAALLDGWRPVQSGAEQGGRPAPSRPGAGQAADAIEARSRLGRPALSLCR